MRFEYFLPMLRIHKSCFGPHVFGVPHRNHLFPMSSLSSVIPYTFDW
jgi:hypothetical protein